MVVWVAVVAVCFLPSAVFTTGSINAQTIRQGCGWMYASQESISRLGLDIGPHVYLGYAGGRYILYKSEDDSLVIVPDEGRIMVLQHRSPRTVCATRLSDVLKPWEQKLIEKVIGLAQR